MRHFLLATYIAHYQLCLQLYPVDVRDRYILRFHSGISDLLTPATTGNVYASVPPAAHPEREAAMSMASTAVLPASIAPSANWKPPPSATGASLKGSRVQREVSRKMLLVPTSRMSPRLVMLSL